MGGRGASSGTSKNGNKYGSQYHMLHEAGNVKYVTKNSRQSETLMETMTKGRVYAHIEGGEVKSIVYFDNNNKRSKQIDLNHAHDGKQPHVHYGYEFPKGEHNASNLTTKQQAMVENVLKEWQNFKKRKLV